MLVANDFDGLTRPGICGALSSGFRHLSTGFSQSLADLGIFQSRNQRNFVLFEREILEIPIASFSLYVSCVFFFFIYFHSTLLRDFSLARSLVGLGELARRLKVPSKCPEALESNVNCSAPPHRDLLNRILCEKIKQS